MAAKSIGSLFVNLVAKTTGFDKGMKGAQKRLKTFRRSVANVGRKILTFGSILTGVSVGGLAIFIRGQLDAIDKTAKLAHGLGMTTEALGGLQHAAEITGVSNDQLATAMRRMEKTVSDAGVGLSTAVRAFDQLGLSIDALKKMRPEQQFAAIGDALNQVTNQSDKARIAQDVFGRSGQALINTLKLGSRGLADMAAEAKALGLTFTDKQAAKIEEFNDQMTRLKGLLGGLGRRFVIDVAPALAETVQGLVMLLNEMKKRKGMQESTFATVAKFPFRHGPLAALMRMAKDYADVQFQGITTNQGPTATGANRQFMQPFSKEFAERMLREQEKQTKATENLWDAYKDDPWVTTALP